MSEFFANLYEFWGQNYLGGFSDDLYQLRIYPVVFSLSFVITIVGLLIYYKLLDQPRFSKKIIWLSVVAISTFLCGLLAYIKADIAIYNLYADMGQDVPYYETDYMNFAITNALIFFIIALLCSMLLKFTSINHKYIPF